MRTSSDIKAEKDHIFKKYLNADYPRTFVYSALNAFDDSSHIRTKIILGLQSGPERKLQSVIGLEIAKVRKRWITNCDRF